MPQVPSVVHVLHILAFTAVILIFAIPPSSQKLIPAFYHAWKTGFYPDGLPLRRTYTGIALVDLVFMAYGGFFGAAVDGNDEATHRLCLWFLPQLCAMLIFAYWEAGRARSGIIKSATFTCLLAQLLTAGVVLPCLLASHILSIPHTPNFLQVEGLTRARTIFLAVVLGYLVPSLVLMFPPAGITLDGVQIISAIWQPFPLYIAILWSLLRGMDSSILPSATSLGGEEEARLVLSWLKRSYSACIFLSAVSHLTILIPSLFTTDPSKSFANVLIPFWMHQYLPIALHPESIADYRPCGRLLFWHDWLIMTVAAVIFFARSHMLSQRASEPMSFVAWSVRMIFIGVVGGPGAAVAWAAKKREERIAFAHGIKIL